MSAIIVIIAVIGIFDPALNWQDYVYCIRRYWTKARLSFHTECRITRIMLRGFR